MNHFGPRTVFQIASLLAFIAIPVSSAPILQESFDNLSTAVTGGWVITNLSNPVGATSWFQGNPAIFIAQSGPADSYAAANYLNTDAGGGAISNWLLSPAVTLNNGYTVNFYTRTELGSPFADRLQVRLSTNGVSTNVGASESSVGDFTNLLLDINPTFASGGYPESWTLQTLTISGLGGPATGRIAFRYLIDDTTVNGNYIGVDTFSLDDNGVPEPSSIVLTGTALAAVAFLRRRKGASR